MSAAAPTTLGSHLRQERLRKQLDVAAIVKVTRIRRQILEAIEADNFDSIPGGAYRRHFIRQYAQALGMNGEAVVGEFRTQYAEPPLPLPKPYRRRRSPRFTDIVCALLLVGGVWYGYEFMKAKEAGVNFQVHVPAKLVFVERPPQTPPLQPAAPPPAPESSPQTPASTPLHVAFTAIEPVWVSVKCDGNVSYSGVLEQPQSKTFDAADAVTALIGNAGGVVVSLNGKPLGPMGAHGEVQTVELTLHGARRIERQAFSSSDPALRL